MLKFLSCISVGAVVVVVCSLALFAHSPNYNSCVGHNGQNATGRYDAENNPEITSSIVSPTPINLFFLCGGYFAAKNGDAITAVSTALLTGITLLLAYLAFEQGGTSRAQLRAYVFVDTATANYGNKTFSVTLKLKNFGATPGFNAVLRFILESEDALPPIKDIPANPVFVFGPSGVMVVSSTKSEDVFTGKGEKCVLGRLDYRDTLRGLGEQILKCA